MSKKQTRRQYSDEHKSEAVRPVRQSGKPLSQIARELGLNDNMLQVVAGRRRCAGSWEIAGRGQDGSGGTGSIAPRAGAG